jgi:ribosomal protein S18 acetylase RimI-like enzyme
VRAYVCSWGCSGNGRATVKLALLTRCGHRSGIDASEFVHPHLLPANETHSIRTIISRNLIRAGFLSGINMTDSKQGRLQSASNPRRATLDDVIPLSRLFTSAFMDDPVFDYMVRPGEKRRAALATFFNGMFTARDIPQNEVWMSNDGNACVSWLPSGARRGASGIRILKWLPWSYRVFGFERFGRAMAIQEAMERNHPKEPHFYLAFIAVSPEFQGAGLGSRILKATLEKIDAVGMSAYVENSRERNTLFYQRAGFVAQSNISPEGAPPLLAMWRKPHISVG